ncbi:MAG TPA: FHA domain-containing protein, partial [Gammaproteobacteria bacterium]|nr:FHA domain-containing protein [Gammaproteobacteria bacterium]
EALASLSQHIENRNGVWRRQLAEVEQKTTRIHELEIELAQRQARQHAAERHAELQAAHAQQLRARLTPPRDVAVAGDERAAVSAGSSTPDQLREELRREIELQSELGDGAESLRRLRELEGAIRTLEQQMDAGDGTAELPEPVPEPARLVCLTGDELGSLALEKTGVTIGRGSHCGIRIATHYVSREHARLTTSNGRWIIEDLGSRNGVFVNAVRIERQVLDDKDLITIGDTQFRYQSGSVPSR